MVDIKREREKKRKSYWIQNRGFWNDASNQQHIKDHSSQIELEEHDNFLPACAYP